MIKKSGCVFVVAILAFVSCTSNSSENADDAAGQETDTSSTVADSEGDQGEAVDNNFGRDFDSDLRSNEAYDIGVSLQQNEAAFWVAVEDGATRSAAVSKVRKLLLADAERDHNKQVDNIREMIEKEIDGLVIGAVDSEKAPAIVEDQTTPNDIPVVAVAVQIGDPDDFGHQHVYRNTIALVTNDDKDMGARAAEFVPPLAAAKGEKLNIVVLQGSGTAANSSLRDEGFVEVLDESGIEYEISNKVPADFNTDKAKEACKTLLDADDDIDLLFSHSDAMTIGCVETMKAKGRSAIPIASIGGNAQGIEMVKNGEVLGTVCQKPATMGAVATQILIRHLNGEEIRRKQFFYETPVITKDNLDDCIPEW